MVSKSQKIVSKNRNTEIALVRKQTHCSCCVYANWVYGETLDNWFECTANAVEPNKPIWLSNEECIDFEPKVNWP